MRFGFHFLDFTMPGEPESLAGLIRRSAVAAEETGASWFTVMDHYFQMEHFRTARDPMLEGYTVLGYVAAVTERIRLGTLVTGVTYRHPALLAKIVTTLDVLSGGRAFLGIGAAWYEREHLAMGVPYPPIAERFERLEEALQIALQMWGDDDGPFDGRHYQLAETISSPRTVRRPRPPILIGGNGERKTLRLVAQYADAANLIAPDAATVAQKLAALRGHCDTLGRDYDAIERTVVATWPDPTGDPEDFLRRAQELADLGVEHIQLRLADPDPVGLIERFAERIAPRLVEIPVRDRD
jgi:F420-dependent oxidoreductase-like protein